MEPARPDPATIGVARPLDWVVFKVSQVCNLNCTYCYVYNRGDESWRTRPTFVSNRVVDQLSHRIAEQCARYALRRFTVELHGGEPLLINKGRMHEVLSGIRRQVHDVDLHIVLQTNGLLLDREWLELFAAHGVTFGLSLDGPPPIADQSRVDHSGRGSTQALLDTIAALRAEGPLFDQLNCGVLCVLNAESKGAELVTWFADHGFRGVDFLLPDGSLDNPPPNWRGTETYARVLLEAFDAWYDLDDAAPRIRIFEVMMMGLMGVRPHLDAFGGDLHGICVVESNGGIGVVDTIRICGGRFATDTLDIFQHSLDTHGPHFGLAELQEPCATCTACPHFAACRGGYLPHRFDGLSFDNPSMHCGTLYALADRMVKRLGETLPLSART